MNVIPRMHVFQFVVYVLAIFVVGGMGSKNLHAQLQQQDLEVINETEIQHSWQGDFPVSQLNLLPEGQHLVPVGYINNSRTFKVLWKAFKPGEDIPEIDFDTQLVLFVRNTQFYNRISIGRVMVNDGIAELLAMETMSAMPIEDKVAMSMAVISRKAIKGVKSGNEIISIP